MAARRLIAVLLVLLVVSSIAAALAPEARRQETSTSTTATDSTTPDDQTTPDTTGPQADKGDEQSEPAELPSGTLVERTISADPKPDPDPGTGKDDSGKTDSGKADKPDSGKDDAAQPEPQTVTAAIGDRLALQVESEETAQIEIPDLGLLETAAPGAPARFDLFLREPGTYPVRIVGGATVGTIEVTEPAKPDAGGDSKDKPDAKPAAEPQATSAT